jgi:hypothetical protein
MIGGFKRYDSAQVTISICNILINSGYNEGEFITIEQAAPDYEMVVGTDGEVTRSRTNNRSGTLHIKLMQTSVGNTLLTGLSNQGLLAANGADVGAMFINDRISGACTWKAAHCWIAKPPEVTLENKATMRDWTIDFADLIRVDAGS